MRAAGGRKQALQVRFLQTEAGFWRKYDNETSETSILTRHFFDMTLLKDVTVQIIRYIKREQGIRKKNEIKRKRERERDRETEREGNRERDREICVCDTARRHMEPRRQDPKERGQRKIEER